MRKIFTILFILFSYLSFAQSTTVVISQVYGAGGNNGAVYDADYVELHNISTSPVDLTGYSIQYSSATNTAVWTGVSPLPAVSIPAGGYYLIQMSAAGTNGIPLPAPDYVAAPSISMAAANGKVALVNNITPLPACPDATMIDFVGYGTANCSETAPTDALSAANAAFRNDNGCTDTNDNSADFTVAPPAPKNSASPVNICGVAPTDPTLTATTVADFGSVVVATNSLSQSFNLTGVNLTGAPGDITITAPSANFEVSLDNSTWSSSVTVPFTTATLASTPVYVRFTPQALGPQSGNVTISGGGVTTAVNVAVSGNGVATGVATINTTSLTAFGDICINTTAGPNSFTVTGANLTTDDVTVGPLDSYTFSTTSGGTYTPSLTLTQPGGNFSQDVFVKFTPATATSYNGNIPVSGGGLAGTTNVAASGSGIAGVPSVTTGNATGITLNSATLEGQLNGNGCSPITGYGFEYSTTSGFTSGTVVNASNLSGNAYSEGISGLAPGTTYYYKAFATNSGGTGYGVERSFTTLAPPAPTYSASVLADFGSVCVNSTNGPNSFTLTGTNLLPDDVKVGPLDGYTFSTSSTGPFAGTIDIPQPGGAFSQEIFVMFTPESGGSFDGNIPVSGGGASTPFLVAVTGNGNATAADVATGDSLVINHHSATAYGQIVGAGCGIPDAYGIEYSTINGFTEGFGIKVPADSISLVGNFASNLNGLIAGTTYYYRAYASGSGTTNYGIQRSFTTPQVPGGLTIYSNPIAAGGTLHFTIRDTKPGSYSIRLYNSLGQPVFQKNLIQQVNFTDESFIVPSVLPKGVYLFQVISHDFKTEKSILIL